MPVLCQLLIAGHAAGVNYVNSGILGANPYLILIQSQHAVLSTKEIKSIQHNTQVNSPVM